MPDSKHSGSTTPDPHDNSGQFDTSSWPRKFLSNGDISFRLNPRHAKELAAISAKIGMSPNDVVRDMVALSLRTRIRQIKEASGNGSN